MLSEQEFEQQRAVLESLAQRHAPDSQERTALSLASEALLFIYATMQAEFFREFKERIRRDPPARAEYSFSSLDEAARWLGQQEPGVVVGKLVKIGGTAYAIGRDPSKLMLLRTVELAQLEDDGASNGSDTPES